MNKDILKFPKININVMDLKYNRIKNKEILIVDMSDLMYLLKIYTLGSTYTKPYLISPEFINLIKTGEITKIIERELSREANILKNYEDDPEIYMFLMLILTYWYKDRVLKFTTDHHVPSFNDLVGYSEVKKKIKNIKNKKVILLGPPGCGKKKLIESFLFNDENSYVMESNPFFNPSSFHIMYDKREKLPFKSNVYVYPPENTILKNNLELNLGTVFYHSTTKLKNFHNDSIQYIYVHPPNYEERIELFKKYILNFNLEFIGKYTPKIPIGNINFEKLAKKTKFYSCWEIEYMCYNAVINYIYKWRKNKKLKLKTQDIERELRGFECIDWFESLISSEINISSNDSPYSFLKEEDKEYFFNDLKEYTKWRKNVLKKDLDYVKEK